MSKKLLMTLALFSVLLTSSMAAQTRAGFPIIGNSVTINGGAASTFSLVVNPTLTQRFTVIGNPVVSMRFTNLDPVANPTSWSAWEPDSNTKAWTLAAGGAGGRTVWAQYQLQDGTTSAAFSDSIAYQLSTVTHTLSVEVEGSGTADPALGSHSYGEGTAVSVDAQAASGWHLDHWELDAVDVGTTDPYTVTMDADHTLRAVFVETTPTGPTGSILINDGNASTSSTLVALSLTYADAVSGVAQVRYSNDGVWDTESWEAPSATRAWNLTSGDGIETVYYQILNNIGVMGITYSDSITLSTTTAPPPNGEIFPLWMLGAIVAVIAFVTAAAVLLLRKREKSTEKDR